jgi:hypothetical protein
VPSKGAAGLRGAHHGAVPSKGAAGLRGAHHGAVPNDDPTALLTIAGRYPDERTDSEGDNKEPVRQCDPKRPSRAGAAYSAGTSRCARTSNASRPAPGRDVRPATAKRIPPALRDVPALATHRVPPRGETSVPPPRSVFRRDFAMCPHEQRIASRPGPRRPASHREVYSAGTSRCAQTGAK